jgi:putative mRNA 3-end processing factor
MEIKVLGGARQVGRSAILVRGEYSRILLDFGVQIHKEPGFPMHVRPKDVDAVLLTHAHLDHSGAIPLFFLSRGVDWYATKPTIEITKLLLEDFIKVSGFYLPFEYLEIVTMMRRAKHLQLRNGVNVGEFEVKAYEAGHIPGATLLLLENDKKRLLYTGDMNTSETALLRGAKGNYGEIDILITESTYALVDHPPREKVEKEFIEFAKEVIESGGVLLVPAFSVGRAQEIACVLREHRFPYHVAMDGMALKANEILFRYQEFLRDAKLFRKSIDNIEIIQGWSQRKKLVRNPCVIISPAGMLVGGAAVFYNEKVAKDSKNAIAIVSFQIPGTPGRTLLDQGLTIVKGKPVKVKARVKRFDFSSHTGKTGLLNFVKSLKGNPKVIVVHGEEESCLSFARELRERLGLDAYAPKVGETYKF